MLGLDVVPLVVSAAVCVALAVLGNLWVGDASIMPVVSRANTNLTSIMIGERAIAGARHNADPAPDR